MMIEVLMTIKCDVVVVGAGVAGVPAAVAAARTGADVLLVEQRAYPGGTGVAGRHRHICGLYSNTEVPDATLLNGGLVSEICERLHALSPGKRQLRMGKVDVLPYSPAQLQQVFTDLLGAEAKLRTMFETAVTEVALDADRISRLEAGGQKIVACAVVDCSGVGAVIRTHPALHEPAPAKGRQLAGFTVRVLGLEGAHLCSQMSPGDLACRGVAWRSRASPETESSGSCRTRRQGTGARPTGDVDMLPLRVPYEARKGVEAGLLNSSLLFTTFLPGDAPDEGWLRLNLPAPTPSGAVAYRDAGVLLAYLKERVPAFRAARLEDGVPEVLEREGPRLKGLYTLTAEDVLGAKTFPDAAARSAWPIEMWEPERGPVYRYLEPGRFCEIPVRCLKSAVARNLFCAGRCISATREALGSTRVMGCCLALGESAGRAAAEYAAKKHMACQEESGQSSEEPNS
jgi:glycine/D-amino acid oxidase-like deaminating enzyme